MNPIALHLASGASLFSGTALVVLAILVSARCRTGWPRRLRTLLAWLGLVLILASATPTPAWVDLFVLAVFLAWFLSEEVERCRALLRPAALRVALLCAVAALAASEFPYTQPPRLPRTPGKRLYVMGDSISAGTGRAHPPWPEVLAEKYQLSVVNLSRAGATVAEAATWISRMEEPSALVLIEIGGNDLLSGREPAAFGRDLEGLLAGLARPGRTLVMFELPLIPFYAGYGRAQRRLAAKYSVFLLPKRYLVAVLSAADSTVDSLHLSRTGAQLMADTVYPILAPAIAR